VIFSILLIPSLPASWFCYWFSSVFPSLSNRTSRIICLACPLVIAIVLAVIANPTLGASGTDFELPDRPIRAIPALLVAIGAFLVIPTLLLAFAATNLSKHSGSGENHQG